MVPLVKRNQLNIEVRTDQTWFDIFGDSLFSGVDLAFEQLLDNIFGADFMAHFKSRLPASHVDLVFQYLAD